MIRLAWLLVGVGLAALALLAFTAWIATGRRVWIAYGDDVEPWGHRVG